MELAAEHKSKPQNETLHRIRIFRKGGKLSEVA